MSDKSHIGGLTLFIEGVKAPFRAFSTARTHPSLWVYFIIPFALNLLILSALFYYSYTVVYPWIGGLIPSGHAWYLEVLRWLLSPVLLFITMLVCVLLYSVSGTVITAPFNDPLSAKIERLKGGSVDDERFSIALFLGDSLRILKNTIKLLLLLAAANLAFLFLNLVPLAGGILYSLASFLSALFFFGFGFFDFPLERRRLLFGAKLKLLWRFRSLTMGLGLGFLIITFIPLAGFLGLNLCTIGATELFLKHIKTTGAPGR